MVDRFGTYDLLLLAISVPLVLAGLASVLVTVPASYLLGAGGIPAGGLIGYALFVDPP